MEAESDGVAEAISGQIRVAVTLAGHAAEAVARAREQRAREAAAASAEEARELQQRLEAERSVARAALAPAGEAGWIDSASPDEIADAWQIAETWSGQDSEIERARDALATQLRARGIDPESVGGDPAEIRAALEERAASVYARAGEHESRGAELLELAVLGVDDAVDAYALEHAGEGHELERSSAENQLDGEYEYDSAERRLKLASTLEERGVDAEAVEAVVLADTSSALPVAAAVAGATHAATAPTAKRGRVRQADRSLSR